MGGVPMTRTSSSLSRFLIHWAMSSVAVWVATRLVTGIHITGPWWHYVFVALVLGFVGATVGVLLKLMTLPLIVLTLGLFLVIVNAVVLSITASLFSFMTVDGFGAAILGALIISAVNLVLDVVVTKPLTH